MTTDPDPSERLVALRSSRTPQPFPHAQATKIVTAGVSASAVFGIVAYLGHSAQVDATAKTRELQRIAVSQAVAGELYRPAPTVVIAAVPTTAAPTTAAPTVAAQPGAAPAPQVVEVPVPTPAPAPAPAPRPVSQGNQGAAAPAPAPAPANTTKSSG